MKRKGRFTRILALALGLVALVAIPAAVAAAVLLESVDILPALVAGVAVSFGCAVLGISASRRARFKVERSVSRKGERTVRFARRLVFLGLYAAVVGGLALGFYGLLRSAS
jgi:hypothetical protein